MNKLTKRILSFVMSVLMIALMLPLTAFAGSNEMVEIIIQPDEHSKILALNGDSLESTLVYEDGKYYAEKGSKLQFNTTVEDGYEIMFECYEIVDQFGGESFDWNDELSCYEIEVTGGPLIISVFTQKKLAPEEQIFKIFGFAFYVGGRNYFDENGKPSEEAVFYYMNMTQDLNPYFDENWYIDIDYDVYMDLVKENFLNAPEMKDYFVKHNMYNEETNIVHYFPGGFGDAWSWLPLNTFKTEYGYKVQGLFLNQPAEEEGLVEKIDYYDGLYIDTALELTLVEEDGQLKIAGLEKNNFYIIDEELYELDDEGKFKALYNKFEFVYKPGVAFSFGDGIKDFNHTNNGWYKADTGFSYSYEAHDGYILEGVMINDELCANSGTVPANSGSVTVEPIVKTLLDVQAENATVEFIQGVTHYEDNYYTFSQGDAITFKVKADDGYEVVSVTSAGDDVPYLESFGQYHLTPSFKPTILKVETRKKVGGYCGENATWTLENGTLTIKGTGKVESTIALDELQDSIKNIVIEKGITTIGIGAFSNYGEVEKVTLADTVKTIETGAFYYCTGLKEINLGSGVTVIENDAFGQCQLLESIVIPSGVKVIEDQTFQGCTALKSVTIPESVKTIGEAAFDRCPKLANVYYGGNMLAKSKLSIGLYNYDLVEVATWSYGKADNGWVKDNGKWYYFENGAMVKGAWREDSKGWVYLGEDGAMVTNNWVKDSKGWCYAGSDGYVITNKWQQIGGKWYYLDSNGNRLENTWQKDSKGWVYLGSDGAMLTNAWCEDKTGKCYVGSDGYAVTNTWKQDENGWIYLNEKGSMTKSKWVQTSGKWYYLDANGYMVTNKWQKDSKGWVYVGEDGAMVTNNWVQDSQGWCYAGADGYVITNCWKQIGGKWYYLNANGNRLENTWQKDSKGWVYLGSDGAMLTNAWCQDSAGLCYVGSDGYAVTNTWKEHENGWVYLNASGSMTKSKWVKSGNKWYYLNKHGYMVENTSLTIGGVTYNFDANGVCTNK